jgi:predicted porin
MRKTLIAIAVLGAASAPSFADGNVTVYGQVNVAAMMHDDGNTKQMKIENAYTSSRFGLKGGEMLDSGMKAMFKIETSIAPDDASKGNFGSREAWVGLEGGFGKVALGRGKTPYTNMADWFEDYVDLANGLAIYDNKMPFDATLTTGGVLSSRWNNAIRYDSPDMSGFTGSAMLSAGENKDDTTTPKTKSADKMALSGVYKMGAIQLGAAYAQEKNKEANGIKHNAFLLAGTYAMDAFTVAAGFQTAKIKNDTLAISAKRNSIVTTASYTMGSTSLRAGAIFHAKLKLGGNTVPDSSFIRYSMGVKHHLSKRTALLAELSSDANKGAVKDVRFFSVGAMHAF